MGPTGGMTTGGPIGPDAATGETGVHMGTTGGRTTNGHMVPR